VELAISRNLKQDFYIALKANVPIIPVAFNFGKEVNLGTPLMPTGNIDEINYIEKSILKE
jgi:hypothetical protein